MTDVWQPPEFGGTKTHFKIGEVAKLLGVDPHVLRFWEKRFRSVRTERSKRGQRVYPRRSVETLLRIEQLLYVELYTIEGARRQLGERGA
jgi:DNA-binding transcriptional MerR regulator